MCILKYKIIILITSVLSCTNLFSQSAGINTTGAVPNASALLDIDAAPNNNKGLLIPRIPLTATNNNAPIGAGIANSLLVFNTATINDVYPGYYYWDGAKWVRLVDDAWQTLGNTGTNPATNFLGTIDNQDLVFRTNNLEQVRILANGNTGIGTPIPTEKLEINGHVHINTTNPDGGRLIWRGGAGGVLEYRARVHPDGYLGFFPGEVGNPAFIGDVFKIYQNGRAVTGDQFTGFVPTQQFTVTNGNFQLGETSPIPGDGRELIFGEPWENTDNLTMKRVNVANDVSNIEMLIGDNAQNSNDAGIDRFVIKGINGTNNTQNIVMSVQSNGAVRIGSQKIPTTAPNFSVDNETWKLSVTGGYSFFGNYNNDPNVAGNPPGHTFVNGVGGLAVGVNRWGGTSGVDLWNVTTWNAPAANQNTHRGFYFRRYDQAGNEQLIARLEGDGQFYATNYIVVSDKRIKKDFSERKIPVLEKLNQVKIYDYTLRNQYHTSTGNIAFNDAANTKDFGVIAQELNELFPELIHQPNDENKELWGVNYAKLSLINVQAIQEQQKIITEQANEIAFLKKELEELKKLIQSQEK